MHNSLGGELKKAPKWRLPSAAIRCFQRRSRPPFPKFGKPKASCPPSSQAGRSWDAAELIGSDGLRPQAACAAPSTHFHRRSLPSGLHTFYTHTRPRRMPVQPLLPPRGDVNAVSLPRHGASLTFRDPFRASIDSCFQIATTVRLDIILWRSSTVGSQVASRRHLYLLVSSFYTWPRRSRRPRH